MSFEFTGMEECERCGLQKHPDDECESCADKELSRYHFEYIDGERVETVWAIDAERAWHELLKQVETPLPWRCHETDTMTLDMAQMGLNVSEIWKEYHNT